MGEPNVFEKLVPKKNQRKPSANVFEALIPKGEVPKRSVSAGALAGVRSGEFPPTVQDLMDPTYFEERQPDTPRVDLGAAIGAKAPRRTSAGVGATIKTTPRENVGGAVMDVLGGRLNPTNFPLGEVPQALADQAQESINKTTQPLAEVSGEGLFDPIVKAIGSSPVTQHKIVAETIRNLDPTQIPGFVAALSSQKGGEKVAQEAKGMIARIREGDEKAVAELTGLVYAIILPIAAESVGGMGGLTGGFRSRTGVVALPPVEVGRLNIKGLEAGLPDKKPIFIPREDPNYPRTRAGIDPLGLAKTMGEPNTFDHLIPKTEVQTPEAPKPAPTKPVAPKTAKPQAEPPAAKPEPSKIKAALESADKDFQDAWAALQKERRAQKPMSKKGGAIRPITQAEIEVAKAWAKKTGWQAASAVEDFVKHMVELGEEAAHWRRVAKKLAIEESPSNAAQNASTGGLRDRARLPGYGKVEKETYNQWAEGAKEHSTPEQANALASEVHNNNKRLTHEESLGIVNRLNELETTYKQQSAALERAMGTVRDQAALKILNNTRAEIDHLTTALNKSGTLQARDFVARRGLMKDESFIGLYAEQSKAAGNRPLTHGETERLRNQVAAHEKIIAERNARIAQLERDRVGKAIGTYRMPRARRAPEAINVDIEAVKARLKEKWAASKPEPGARSSLFGAEIPIEVAQRVADVVPEIVQLSKLVFEKGIVKIDEHLKAVVQELRSMGIDDVHENEVAAAISGRIKTGVQPQERSAWEQFKHEINSEFVSQAADRQRRASYIRQQEREVRTRYQKEEQAKAYEALRKEREQLAAEAKAAKEAEVAFWKEVRERQREFDAGIRAEKSAAAKARTLDRKESIQRWKASVQGQRAGAMNRIDNLQRKLDTFNETGIAEGQKSKLPSKPDPELQKLELKEAALRYEWDRTTKRLKMQQEFEMMPEWRQILTRFNPYRLVRESVASTDDSFPFNQGGMSLLSDPGAWAKSVKASLKSFTDKGFEAVNAEIRAHPQYNDWKAANLFEDASDIADIFGASDISDLPLLHQSEQMYAGAGEMLRLQLASRWREISEAASGKPSTFADLKRIASEVKTWTGQGEWGKNLKGFSRVAFAARYTLTQFEVAFGVPLGRTAIHWAQTGNSGPLRMMVRKYARAYGTAIGAVALINEAAKRFGPKDENGNPLFYIETNRLSSNFGKAVYRGVATFDVIPAPMRLYGFLTREWEGKRISQSGKEQDVMNYEGRSLRADMTYQWLGGKLHPVPRWVWARAEAMARKDGLYFGQSYDMASVQGRKDGAIQGLPISIQTGKEVYDSDMTTAEKLMFWALTPFLNVNTVKDFPSGKMPTLPGAGQQSIPKFSTSSLPGVGK